MRLAYFVFLVLLVTITNAAIDYAHLYDPDAKIHLKYDLVYAEDQQHIKAYLDFSWQTRSSGSDFEYHYAITKENKNSPEEWLSIDTILHLASQRLISMVSCKLGTAPNYLMIRAKHLPSNTEQVYSLPLEKEGKTLFLSKITEKWPLFESYIELGDTLKVHFGKDSVYVTHYGQQFEPADPPFLIESSAAEKFMKVDTSFWWVSGTPQKFNKKGLFYVQADTSKRNGASIYVTDQFYPKYTLAENLLQPLLYISTNEEYEQQVNATNAKEALDKFWLDVGQSEDKARRIIRAYYRRITRSNQLFTNYKAGWKTDQGMIYALFGVPDLVLKDGPREEWVYYRTDILPKINFTFYKVKNPYAQKHFVLIRNKKYSDFWFRTVDLWRKGRTGF